MGLYLLGRCHEEKPCLLLVCSAYFSTLKTVSVCSFETSVNLYQTILYHVPEDISLHSSTARTCRCLLDSFCGLVVRVTGYRSRGLGFDSRPYQIF
jgi:hypothetical protein